jgi:hypothetical protein
MQSLTTHSFSETYNLYLKEYPEGRNGDTALWDFMLSNDGSYNRVLLLIFLNPQGPGGLSTRYNPLYSKPLISGFLDGNTARYNGIEFLPSITINNRQFDSVYHSTFYSADNTKPVEHIYFNRKTGLLKFVQHRLGFNRSLELERWYVPGR